MRAAGGLDRADRVEGQARGRRDRATGLDHQQRARLDAVRGQRLRDHLAQRRRVLRDRRALVGRDVANAEAAAQVELVDGRTGLGLDREHQLHHAIGRGRERVEPEHLRADMTVQPGEAQRAARDHAPHRAQRVAALEAEAELGVFRTGLDVLVRVRLDARRHAHEQPGRVGATGGEPLEAVELVEGVDDDPPHSGLDRGAQLVGRLVVAVEHDALGREAGVERHVQLAAGGHVEIEALVAHEPRHRRAEERLARVRDPVAELRSILAAAAAELALVVHVERRAELGREPDEIDTPHRHAAVGPDACRCREQRQVERRVARGTACSGPAGHSASSSSSASSRAISVGRADTRGSRARWPTRRGTPRSATAAPG